MSTRSNNPQPKSKRPDSRRFEKGKTLFATAMLLSLVLGLGACKSRARTGCSTCAAPSAVGSPGVAAVPSQSYAYETPGYDTPNEFAATGYPPPAPPLTTEPLPSARQAELDAARRDAALAQERNAGLERQLDAERSTLNATTDALREMEERIAELEVEGAPPAGVIEDEPRMADLPSDRTERLIDDLRSNRVADVSREGDMIIVRCTNSFKAGSDKLRRDAELMTALSATANALNRYNGASVAVVGHSDGDPIRKSTWPNNDALSLARAQRVAQVLSENGVDENRISIDGRGFREPLVSPEVGAADKARNRRVEIMIRL
jgi:flagellar motor protein MotB